MLLIVPRVSAVSLTSRIETPRLAASARLLKRGKAPGSIAFTRSAVVGKDATKCRGNPDVRLRHSCQVGLQPIQEIKPYFVISTAAYNSRNE